MKFSKYIYPIIILANAILGTVNFIQIIKRQNNEKIKKQILHEPLSLTDSYTRRIDNITVFKGLDSENKVILNTIITDLSNRYSNITIGSLITNKESVLIKDSLSILQAIKEESSSTNSFLVHPPIVSYSYKVSGAHIVHTINPKNSYSIYNPPTY